MVNACNPSTSEECKTGEDKSHSQSENSWRQDCPFPSEVEVRASDGHFAFLIFSLNSNVSGFLLFVHIIICP